MANNKVQLKDGTVLIDLTGDTVTPSTLKSGITAHDASGNPIVGTMDGEGGSEHYVMIGQYSADNSGNITIAQVNNVDVAEFIAGDMDTIYCKIDGPLGSLLFHSASRDTQEGIYHFFCRTESAFYLLTTKLYSSVESIPADTYYIEVEIEGSTLYAAISVDKIDVAKEGEEQIFVAVSSNNGTDTITRVEHGDIQRLFSLLLNGLYWRIHVVVSLQSLGSTTIANLQLFNVNPNGNAIYTASLCTSTINQTFALFIGSASSHESVPDDADYEEALEYGDGIIYVWYKFLLETYVNPEISTDIATDATTDAKTASPKAVKTFVENKGYATEQYVTQAIAGIANFSFQILNSGEYDANGKPTITGAMNKIYLVPKASDTNNVYAEWLYVGSDFELIGSTTVDMAGYVKESDLGDAAFSNDYRDLDNTPTIPTVPVISTDITTDAASDVKTASPKAVKTYVDGAVPSVPVISTDISTDAASDAKTASPKAVKTYVDGAVPTNPLTLSSRSSYDCDTRYDGKVWLISNGTHCPSGSHYGALFTMPYRQASGNAKPDFGAQIFLPNGDDSTKPNAMFYRTSLANSWNGWKEVAIEGECNADTIDGYHIVVSSSEPAAGTSNNIITIVV